MCGTVLMTPYTPPPSRKRNIADAFFSSDEEAEKSYHEEVLATQEAKQVAAEKLRCSTFCESLLDGASPATLAKLATPEPEPE